MADWRKLAKTALLADGRIDTKEVNIIRKELFADGRIDKSELEFLFELRKGATSAVQSFIQLLNDAIKSVVLADGTISDKEAAWLKKYIVADGKVDDAEKQLLRELKGSARSVSKEFEALCAQCGV